MLFLASNLNAYKGEIALKLVCVLMGFTIMSKCDNKQKWALTTAF